MKKIKNQHCKFSLMICCLIVILLIFLSADTNSNRETIPQEIKRSKQYKRWEWFHQPRAFPHDTLSIHTYHRERIKETTQQQRKMEAFNLDNRLLNQPGWTSLGPIGVADYSHIYSGRVRGIAVHPSNSNIVYIGAASGGLWKSIDGGTTWMDLNEDFSSNTFGAIAIDPNNPDVIYAGTGEVMAGWVFNIYDGRGLFKSTDGGNSWTQITNGFGSITQFSAISVSPHNSNIVFAALGGGYYLAENLLNNRGIWRSTDAGLTWTRTLNVNSIYGDAAYDVIVHPTDPNKVYAAFGGFGSHGFYISEDNGITWRQSNTGLPNDIDRMQIAIANSSPSIIYAVTYQSSYDTEYKTKAFKSTDSGNTWNQIGEEFYFGTSHNDQGFYDLCIAVNPTNPDHILVGNVMFNTSTDGENFTQDNKGMHVDFHRIVFAPSNNNDIYVGCDGGIYRSTNGGTAWHHKNNGLSTLQLYGMASHPTNKNIMLGGSQDNGGFKTTDYGATPWAAIAWGDITGFFYEPTDPNIVYQIRYHRTMMKSTDGGTTFYPIQRYFDAPLEKTLLIHPNNNQCLFASYQKKIIRSLNRGDSWTPITGELTQWGCESIAQSQVNPNIMILASRAVQSSIPQVMISTDEGFNWTEVTSNIPGVSRWISRVLTHPTEANTLFMVRTGYGSEKVYRSTDLGASWTNITGNLPDIPHSDLFIDPQNTNHYYVANDFGVYASFNSGISWMRLGNGMPFVVATDLDYFDYGGDRLLRIATYGRGVYELDLNQVIISEFTVAGNTSYYSNDHPIANAPISLGDYQTLTNTNGAFVFAEVIEGNYTLKPSHDNNLNSAISAFDASKILRHVVGTDTINPYQKIAADVSGNGSISALDASYILRHVVGTITEFPVGDDWTFIPNNFSLNQSNWNNAPDSILYTPLNSDQFNQNFKGIVYGDVSGNWLSADQELTMSQRALSSNSEVSWGDFIEISDDEFTAPLNINFDQGLQSAEIEIGFNPDHLIFQKLSLAEKLKGFSIEYSLNPGQLNIAMAGVEPVLLSSELINLQFKKVKGKINKQEQLELRSVKINECVIKVEHLNKFIVSNSEPPGSFTLFQSYPNPFNLETIIQYQLPQPAKVKLNIFDLKGRKVRTLVNGVKTAGHHIIQWNGQDESGIKVASGVYFARIEARSYDGKQAMFSDIKKMLLIK